LKKLKKTTIVHFSILYIILGLCFFLPAGTFLYWEAWLYIVTFIIPMMLLMRYLMKNDPNALKRRLETGERRHEQKVIVNLANLLFLGIFLIPGFDHRYNWSSVPFWLVIIADLIFLIGYYLFYLVMKENSFASRTVKVEQNVQKVITTGPYSKVRHPMYSAIIIMFGITPLALGSFWALLVDLTMIILIPLRIKYEERVLITELPGYEEYTKKTRYRLIPGIW
jgi:protein-S-isoprenylcysteine O-methyltransferase Ste14